MRAAVEYVEHQRPRPLPCAFQIHGVPRAGCAAAAGGLRDTPKDCRSARQQDQMQSVEYLADGHTSMTRGNLIACTLR